MPIRMLRDWTDSDKMNSISVHAERFFVRLIMKVDDYGIFPANKKLLRAGLFPLQMDSVRESDITRCLEECQAAGLIIVYEAENKEYLQIIGFNQRLDRARVKYPLPTGENSISNGIVYFMGEPESTEVKIGFSLNPWARVREVKYSTKKNVELRMQFKGSMNDEKELHKILREYNIEKEWFDLPVQLIDWFSVNNEENKTAKELIVALRSNSSNSNPPEKNTNTKKNTEEEKEGEGERQSAPPPQPDQTFTEEEKASFRNFQEWIEKFAPRVGKMKEPFTINQYLALKEKGWSTVKIRELLADMHNWADLHKKRVSAYLTLLNWKRREEK